MTNLTDNERVTKYRITVRGSVVREVLSLAAADGIIATLNEADRSVAVVTTVVGNSGDELLLG